jgi:pyrroline-5-carboxylate reductase
LFNYSFKNYSIYNGFTNNESVELYTKTLKGTAELLKNRSVDKIINKVSTSNGVTQMGIDILNSYNIDSIIAESFEKSFNHIISIKKKFN